MSSEVSVPVPVPRTAVPLGVNDPVEKARAELKAALFAIEEKVNVPKRVEAATRVEVVKARRFARRNPSAAAAAAVGVALTVGVVVWGVARLITR